MVEKKSYVGGAQGRWVGFRGEEIHFWNPRSTSLGGVVRRLTKIHDFYCLFSLFWWSFTWHVFEHVFLISGACVEFVNDVCWFLDPWPSDVSSFIAIEGEWCEQFLAKECVGVYYRDHSFMVPIHLPKAALHITMAVLPRWWIPPSWSGEGGGWR